MLIDSLKRKQREAGQNHTAFAARLGISYYQWNSLCYGRRPITTFVLRGVVNEFPDLRDEVLVYLGTNGMTLADNGTLDNALVAAGSST